MTPTHRPPDRLWLDAGGMRVSYLTAGATPKSSTGSSQGFSQRKW